MSRNIGRLMFLIYCIVSLVIPTRYDFMLMNIILAFIPTEIAYLLELYKPRKKSEWPLFIIVAVIFIFLSPNIFYMVTDLIHLNAYAFDFMNGLDFFEWLDFMYLVSGVMIALYFYSLVLILLERFITSLYLKPVIILGFMIITSVGIFIGRFLRFHSVHLLTHPFSIIVDTFKAMTIESILWIALLTCIQVLYWLMLKGVRRA